MTIEEQSRTKHKKEKRWCKNIQEKECSKQENGEQKHYNSDMITCDDGAGSRIPRSKPAS
ncbi:hypothetical protein E2C01_098101 [Portunus trituberculatus]|uniref:Uncharacterized protein n=1 Tax=Portunus trituberculatus TaxID=210409 RepID=A0A5B7JWX1_PORTR|nr:hypothetical protein [Portunus trituberculatus]